MAPNGTQRAHTGTFFFYLKNNCFQLQIQLFLNANTIVFVFEYNCFFRAGRLQKIKFFLFILIYNVGN